MSAIKPADRKYNSTNVFGVTFYGARLTKDGAIRIMLMDPKSYSEAQLAKGEYLALTFTDIFVVFNENEELDGNKEDQFDTAWWFARVNAAHSARHCHGYTVKAPVYLIVKAKKAK
jgi:hypothetical protein